MICHRRGAPCSCQSTNLIRKLASFRGSDPRARITAARARRARERAEGEPTGSRSRRDRGRAVGEPVGEPKFWDLPAYTICLWRFNQKSQFSGSNLTNLTSSKLNKNFAGYCHYSHKDTVEKLAQTLEYFLSYSALNFRKNRVFLSKTGTTTTTTTTTTRTHFVQKWPILEFIYFARYARYSQYRPQVLKTILWSK